MRASFLLPILSVLWFSGCITSSTTLISSDLGMELLETSNMLQIAGRAGRRGMDVEGACVISATAFEGPEDAITILTNPIKPVISQFSPSYALAVNLIDRGQGKLQLAKSMVEKSFAVWEGQQREQELKAALKGLGSEESELSPDDKFLNALQLTLEKELIEAKDGTSPTGTSRSKVSKLTSLVDVLSNGKKLQKISKKYTGAVSVLELEETTLEYLEQELRQLDAEVEELGPDLPPSSEIMELMSEIKTQRRRVTKGEREVNNNILSIIAKVANNRIEEQNNGSDMLTKALIEARQYGEESSYPDGAPLEPGELNTYIKRSSKDDRRPLLDQTTSAPSSEDENESWNQMLSLFSILSAYGVLVSNAESENRYIVTEGGRHVGSIGMDNSLWVICSLGGAWDVEYVSQELDNFEDALANFEKECPLGEQEEEEPNDIPKPQREAETLTDYLCDMNPSEIAGYVSSLVVDSPRRAASALESFQKLTHAQQRAVQGALLALERLVEVQRRMGLDDTIGKCQIELSSCDVVTAWASGCSWNEALAMSGAAPGDLVRVLSRVLDALKQLGNLPFVPARADGSVCLEARGIHPKIRTLCKQAAQEMDRYPVKDVLPFEEEEMDANDGGGQEGDKDEEKNDLEVEEVNVT